MGRVLSEKMKRLLAKFGDEEGEKKVGMLVGADEFRVRELKKGAAEEHKERLVREAEGDQDAPLGGEPWNPQHKYILGWSDGERPCFMRRTPNGQKIVDSPDDYEHHFFVKTKEWKAKVSGEFLELHRKAGIYWKHEHLPGGEWTKVYAHRFVTQTNFIKERGETEGLIGLAKDKIDKYPRDRRYKDFYTALTAIGCKGCRGRLSSKQMCECGNGVMTYEADLSPRLRFMSDRQIRFEDRFRDCYFDIETDDRVAGFERIWERRVLSIAWYWVGLNEEIESGCVVLKEDTDRAERNMFLEFLEVMRKSECMYAWNGNNFDFKILPRRMSMRGISADECRLVAWHDLLMTYRRFYTRGSTTALGTSFSLGDVGVSVLKIPKMDWRARINEICGEGCHPVKPQKFYDLWRSHPEVLKEYNLHDAKLLYLLEKENGFSKIDQAFNRITNCLVTEANVSSQIDSLLLKKAAVAGTHFKTRTWFTGELHRKGRDITKMSDEERAEQGFSSYTGGYVFPPVPGLHRNVAALDFKSLYPSMMVLFNLSIDTYVPPEEVDKHDPEDLLTCPTGAKFLKNVEGFVPSVFKETLVRRKKYSDMQAQHEIGSEKFLLYYRMSYSFKRLGLSFYGEMGNNESRYFNPRVAEAVTLSGQFFIKKTADLSRSSGYPVLYGDTDSIYISASPEQAWAFVKKTEPFYKELCVAEGFNVDFDRKWIVELEYENHFKTIFYVSKKRYAGLMNWYKGQTHPGYVEVKGLEYVRSDNTKTTRNLQFNVMNKILQEEAPAPALERFVFEECKRVMRGALGVDEVMLATGLEKDVEQYKTKAPHVRVAEHVKATSPTEYYSGMKVQWVMVDSKAKEAVWFPEWNPVEQPYDAAWYWDNKIYPPTYRVLKAVYPDYGWEHLFVGKAPKAKKEAPI